MKAFFVRGFCGSLGVFILTLYFALVLHIQIDDMKVWCVVIVIAVFSGIVHVIRLRKVPMVHLEILTCSVESILVTIIAIVCLNFLLLLANFTVFIIGFAIAVGVLLIYPSHVLRWDHDHGLR